MSGRGLEWYPRDPIRFLGGIQGLTDREIAVYNIVVDLIYIHGGSINNDPKWISGWISNMGSALVRRTIADLVMLGKVQIEGDQITNVKASEVIGKQGVFGRPEADSKPKTQKKLRKNSEKTERKVVKNSQFSDPKSSENKDLTTLDKRREDKSKKEDPNGSSKKRGSRLSKNWSLPRDWGEWALTQGWDETTVRIEAEKFRDYWVAKSGKDATKLDWQATWRNWMRNSRQGKKTDDRKPSKQARRLNAFIRGAREEP